MLSKQQLRQELKKKRYSFSESDIHTRSLQISERLLRLPEIQKAETVAIYSSLQNEVKTTPLRDPLWFLEKRLYLPRIQSMKPPHMIFLPLQPSTTLEKNKWGILEPKGEINEAIQPECLDLVFVPLLAFDSQGNRLGMGAGFYDATFSFIKKNRALQPATLKRPILIGLAYDWQKTDKITVDEWDVQLDLITTETQTYYFR